MIIHEIESEIESEFEITGEKPKIVEMSKELFLKMRRELTMSDEPPLYDARAFGIPVKVVDGVVGYRFIY